MLRTSNGKEAGSLFGSFGSVATARDDILRYDTPSIGPVGVGVSIDGDDNWAVQASLSTDMGGSSLIAGAFLAEDPGTDEKMFGIAGGVAFANGTSVNAAYGSRDSYSDSDNHDDVYVNLSHTWGNTSVAIDYRLVDNATEGREGQSLGLGFNQSLGNGVDVYAGYHNHSVDEDGGPEIEDMNVFHIGSMVRFN